MKFENVKVGDDVYIEEHINIGWHKYKSFYVPKKVSRVIEKSFEVNGHLYRKKDGSIIKKDSHSMVYALGDKVSFRSVPVCDETDKLNEFKIRLKIMKEIHSLFRSKQKDKNFEIKYMEVMPDHVHVFASAHPKYSPGYIYKMLKGISARKLFLKNPGLHKNLWKGHLWNPSTYVETVGHVSEDVIAKYIEDQKKHD